MLAGMLAVMLAGSGAAMAAEPGSSAAGNNGATTTYRWVDAQGVVHYSDTPQPGAQKLEIAPAQTFQPAPLPTTQSGREIGPRADEYTCLITQPQSQQSIYAPETVPVSVQLSPELRSGDRVQVTFDGTAVSPVDDSGLDFQIDMPIRGQHEVTATVVDSNGKTVCTTPSVTFYVRRPSVLAPQSPTAHPAPPRPPLGR
jgi:Domain of unknown function (DUF4124)